MDRQEGTPLLTWFLVVNKCNHYKDQREMIRLVFPAHPPRCSTTVLTVWITQVHGQWVLLVFLGSLGCVNQIECAYYLSFVRVYFVSSKFGSFLRVSTKDKSDGAMKVTSHGILAAMQCLFTNFYYRSQRQPHLVMQKGYRGFILLRNHCQFGIILGLG